MVSAAVGVRFARDLFSDDPALACIGIAIAIVMFFVLVVARSMHGRHAIDPIQPAALEVKANSWVGESLP